MRLPRVRDRVDKAVGTALTRLFDGVLKRHHDEQMFWDGLFVQKLRLFEETGRTDWDVPSSRSYYDLLLGDFTRLVGRPSSAVELGCGTAVLSLLLAAGGCRTTLVDRSAAALEYAGVIEARMRQDITFSGSVSYVRADFLDLDPAIRGEVVHNVGVLEEMPMGDSVRVLSSMRQRAESQVVVGVPNFFNPYLLDIWRRGGKGTERYFSRRTLERVFHEAGLVDVTVVNTSCIHPLLPAQFNRGLGFGFLHLGKAMV
jgi:SAM-dependent methyltransferase